MLVQTIWVANQIAATTGEHSHNYYQLIYCKESGGFFDIGQKRYTATTNMVYFIQSSQTHQIHNTDNMHLMEIKFVTKDAVFSETLKCLPTAFFPWDLRAFEQCLFNILDEGCSQLPYSNEATNAALELLLIRLLRPYLDNRREPLNTLDFNVPISKPQSRYGHTEVAISALLHRLEYTMEQKYTLSKLCKITNLSKSALVEMFNRKFNMSPMQYITRIRLEKAKELLTNSSNSITNIAAMTGFNSVHYFSRYFKQIEGITPSKYRDQSRKSKNT